MRFDYGTYSGSGHPNLRSPSLARANIDPRFINSTIGTTSNRNFYEPPLTPSRGRTNVDMESRIDPALLPPGLPSPLSPPHIRHVFSGPSQEAPVSAQFVDILASEMGFGEEGNAFRRQLHYFVEVSLNMQKIVSIY